MQLKRQSVETWLYEKRYSKGNNTSRINPIPRQEIFKPVDHVKYEGQIRSQYLLFVQFPLSFQAVVSLTKTAINQLFFFLI